MRALAVVPAQFACQDASYVLKRRLTANEECVQDTANPDANYSRTPSAIDWGLGVAAASGRAKKNAFEDKVLL